MKNKHLKLNDSVYGESELVKSDSLDVLKEFENIVYVD